MPVLRVGRRRLKSGSGGTATQVNAFDQMVQAQVPLAGAAEVDEAVAAASAVAEEWRGWRPERRREVLLRLAGLIRENRDEFARLGSLDNGAPIAIGAGMADLSAEWTSYYAGWCDKLAGEVSATYATHGTFSYTSPEPYGIIGVILTWNGPVVSLGMSVAAPLAAGNCVVVKPSEVTPFSPGLYADLAADAGIPDGVLSMLPGGPEAGDAQVRHHDVAKISFVGGEAAGRQVLTACASQLKPAVMELGGKSAAVVLPDADLDAVASWAALSAFGKMSGQACAIATRLLVHDDVYEDVVERLLEITSSYELGDPGDPRVRVGPVINRAARDRIVAMVDRVRQGSSGTILCGGGVPAGELAEKNFVEPTIIADVDPAHEIAQTEVFGPVLLVSRFSDEDQAVALANGTRYGLAAYIWSSDLELVHRLAGRLRSGGVYVNGAATIVPYTPYGGTGLSGFGRQGARAGIDEFVRYKTVSLG